MKEIIDQIHALQQAVSEPFWHKWDFWISNILTAIGLVLTVLAYIEAREAKKAAQSAAKTVKTLTVAMELTDIVQKFDRLDEQITYSSCRDFLTETTRKVNRLTAPFKEDETFKEQIATVESSLGDIRTALEGVRPYGVEFEGAMSLPRSVSQF